MNRLNRLIFATLLLMMTGFSTFADAALVDNGGGLIYDTGLNITWLQEPNNYAMTWNKAMDWVAGVNAGGVSGWRLPTGDLNDANVANEMGHLSLIELGNTRGSNLTYKGIFGGLTNWRYWTGNVDLHDAGGAWYFDFSQGMLGGGSKGWESCALAVVHSGNVGTPVPSVITLTITKPGTGSSIIISNPSGIDCGTDCTETYNSGASIILTATPDAGSTFSGWSGNCSGSALTSDVLI